MSKNLISFFAQKKELILISLIIAFSAFLRFYDLGYSSYYGDETKTLYLDKTIPATQFLLDQRKGPVQFLAAWFMEKITGGYFELYIRVPFALAGTLSVLIFYLLGVKLLGKLSSLLSTFIYGLSGFSIAFSRTAQYQSFLLLFGLLGIYFFILHCHKGNRFFLLLSSLSVALSIFSHYDGVFFLIPIIYIYLIQKRHNIKHLFFYFIFPIVLLLSIFYIPYTTGGYMSSNTLNYVAKRFSGYGYEDNNSLNTFLVYNPFFVHLTLIIISFLYLIFFRNKDKIGTLFLLWFLSTFLFFQVFVSNPGTHIHNYFLPLYFLIGAYFVESVNRAHNNAIKYFVKIVYILILVFSLLISLYVFVPGFNNGYPWRSSSFLGLNIPSIKKSSSHLYLYGFPYNRKWNDVRDYLYSIEGVRGYYTNDSAVSSKYYLQKLDLTPPGDNFLPQYYIDVQDSMEFKQPEVDLTNNYTLEKQFYIDEVLVSSIYKKIIPPDIRIYGGI